MQKSGNREKVRKIILTIVVVLILLTLVFPLFFGY